MRCGIIVGIALAAALALVGASSCSRTSTATKSPKPATATVTPAGTATTQVTFDSQLAPSPTGANEAAATATMAEPTSTATAAAATAASTEQPPTAVSPDEQDPRLLKLLPELTDMPAGWTVATDSDDSTDPASDVSCDNAVGDSLSPDGPQAKVAYQGSEFGPFLAISAYYLDGDAANDMMSAGRAILGCDSYTDPSSDPPTVWQITDMSFPDLGDDTYARKLTTDTAFGPLGGDFALIRYDHYVVLVAQFGFGSVDSQATADYATQVVQQLEKTFPRGIPFKP